MSGGKRGMSGTSPPGPLSEGEGEKRNLNNSFGASVPLVPFSQFHAKEQSI